MGKGPLEDPRLREIEAKLNQAQFDEAQHLLAALTNRQGIEAATAYFSTRLLYQRGRIDNAGMVERLVYLGPSTQLVVRLANGASLQALVQNQGRPVSWQQGTAIAVHLPADALRVLPESA